MKNRRAAGVWLHFTVADGLPDLKIESIYEDSRGRLWIGTHDRGVVCFDNKTFTTFMTQDGLTGNRVCGIVEDKQGRIWFGTNRGLSWYDDNGLHRLMYSLPYSFLWGCCADAEGGVWFGLERRAKSPPTLAHWDGESFELIPLKDSAQVLGDSLHALAIDPQGNIWCGGYGLYYYDRASGISQSFDHLAEATRGGHVYDIHIWPDGQIMLASSTGVYKLDGREFYNIAPAHEYRFVVIGADPRSQTVWLNTLDGKLARCDGDHLEVVYEGDTPFWYGMCVDRLGRLWLGTYGMGLYCYDSQRIEVFGAAHGLPAHHSESVAESPAGDLWAGTKGGLVRFDARRSRAEMVDLANSARITCLYGDREGRLWIGLYNQGLYLYADGEATLVHKIKGTLTDIPESISTIAADDSGKIWFSYKLGGGFGYVEDGRVQWFKPAIDAVYPTWIGALACSARGHVWLGSHSEDEWQGLYRFDGTVCEKISAVPSCFIHTLCEGDDGRLWIGTNQGLMCLDGDQVSIFTQRDGLSCDIITSIIQSSQGTIWIGTEGGGLCAYDGQVFQTVQVPGQLSCNIVHDLAEAADGSFWMATNGGLVHYVPQRSAPLVSVTTLQADEEYAAASAEEISFPSTAGRVGFQFSGDSQVDLAAHLVYRYRLDGADEQWRQTQHTVIDYAFLKPGSYTFFVQAIDRDLMYSATAELSFTVTEDPRIDALNEALSTGANQGSFIGQSPAMRETKAQFREAAETDLTVLVLGETGTGKSIAAKAVHELSQRQDGPFIYVNCGMLQRDLVNSELFGHEKGAFTGAHSRRLGKFELAQAGTIFLDEIGDLPLDSQTNLLQVLQEQQIERVGGSQTIAVDVRVVAATNRDLDAAVSDGTFRADLFYRLNVYTITIPPLRERKDDIPLLADYFAEQFSSHLNRAVVAISPKGMDMLKAYDWPGNVRELEHTIQRAVITARAGLIEPEHLARGIESPAGAPAPAGEFSVIPLEEQQRQYLTRVLEHTGGVIYGERGAAALLDMHPNTLRSRLRKLGIKFLKQERGAKSS